MRIAAVGDVALPAMPRSAGSGVRPLAEVQPLLVSCDAVFANLESVLTDHPLEGRAFWSSTAGANVLADANLRLIHLANNHVLDHGPEGLRSTLTALEGLRLQPLGAGADQGRARALVRTDFCGVHLGWLGCGRTLQPQPPTGPCFWELEPEALITAVETARASVDILAVSVHTGYMYLDYPDPELRGFAHRLADAGADLILMHHPHVLQGVEVRDRSVICYSLGNFLFDWRQGAVIDQTQREAQEEGAVFVFDFGRESVAALTVVPTWIQDGVRVRWARGERGQRILERLQRISLDLRSDYRAEFHRQRAMRNTGLTLKTLASAWRLGRRRELLSLLMRARPRHLAMLARWLVERRKAGVH